MGVLAREFLAKKMHVDGLQEIRAVNGYKIALTRDAALADGTEIISSRHRDLAPSQDGLRSASGANKPAPATMN